MLHNLPGHLDRYFLEFVRDKDSVMLYYGLEKRDVGWDKASVQVKGGVFQEEDPEKLFAKVVGQLHLAKLDLIERIRWDLLGTRQTNPKQGTLKFKRNAL